MRVAPGKRFDWLNQSGNSRCFMLYSLDIVMLHVARSTSVLSQSIALV